MITTTLLIIATLLVQSCNKPTEPAKESISITVEDVSCTEAWLRISDTNAYPNITVIVKRDDTDILTLNLNKADTVIVDESLLPNKSYTYRAVKLQGGKVVEASKPVTAVTLDTTSHNFIWQTFEFGQHSSSVLYDVAIINENNIWAVGEIYMKDSLGNPDSKRYNLVVWDGNEWKVKRIPYNYQGSVFYHPIQSIFAFESTDIWFCGNGVIRWDGNDFLPIPIPSNVWGPYQMNKLWGSGSNDLYAVGNGGNIAHYQNGVWTKIESGTSLGLADIFGNEMGEIYACGGNLSTGHGIVLKINSNKTTTKIIESYYYGTGFDSTKMFTENLYGPLVGIWVDKNGTTHTLGNLIYRYNCGKWDYAKGIEYNDLNSGYFSGRGFSWSIRGKENNDFIFVGERNTVRYFNGIRAVQIGEPFSYTSEYRWYKVDYKQNKAVIVGSKSGVAAVTIFTKQY